MIRTLGTRAGAAAILTTVGLLAGAVGTTSTNAAGSTRMAQTPCGFSTPWDALYNHRGDSSIKIRVRFNYIGATVDIDVKPGVTNLSNHSQLQDRGMITNAWCIERR